MCCLHKPIGKDAGFTVLPKPPFGNFSRLLLFVETRININDKSVIIMFIINKCPETTLIKHYNNRVVKNYYNLILDCRHWLYHILALGCIKSLVHADVKYNSDVVRYFLKALINDSIAVRKMALKVVLFILIQNKPKFKKIIKDPYEISKCPKNEQIMPGVRADNKWLLYDPQTFPTTSEEWEEPRYIHDQHSGFYSWPKELEVYAPYSEQITPAKRMENLTPQEKEIYDFFSNKQNLDLLMKYLSLEEKKERINLTFRGL